MPRSFFLPSPETFNPLSSRAPLLRFGPAFFSTPWVPERLPPPQACARGVHVLVFFSAFLRQTISVPQGLLSVSFVIRMHFPRLFLVGLAVECPSPPWKGFWNPRMQVFLVFFVSSFLFLPSEAVSSVTQCLQAVISLL